MTDVSQEGEGVKGAKNWPQCRPRPRGTAVQKEVSQVKKRPLGDVLRGRGGREAYVSTNQRVKGRRGTHREV